MFVSTHSRPKAAGFMIQRRPPRTQSFNTQPPEGGWRRIAQRPCFRGCFNTQPPEGGWVQQTGRVAMSRKFQHTAARRRLEQL